MRFPQPYTLKQIATIINAKYIGDDDFSVLGMNEIHVVQPGDIVFVDHPKYYDKALQSKATIVLINKEVECPEGKALLISDDPFRDFNKLTDFFKPFVKAFSLVAPTAVIGKNTIIQPGAFIGNNVKIGKNCLIHSNVSVYDDCVIGDNVTIHAGTVLGADAFYYKKRPEGFDKLKSGEKCLIASQTGIAGCVVIEDEVTIWGQVGMTSGITIGKKAVILAQSGVSKSLEGNQTYFGYPAGEAREKYREMSALKQLISAK